MGNVLVQALKLFYHVFHLFTCYLADVERNRDNFRNVELARSQFV